MQNLLAEYHDKLSSNNYKLTSQRKDILTVLINNKDRHFSVEDLYNEVKKVNPDVGLATIYRNLELFCSLNITHMLEFESDYKHYELVSEDDHHHHLICMNCDKIIEFNDEDLVDFEERLAEEYDFDMVKHYIKFYGYCNSCQNSNEGEME